MNITVKAVEVADALGKTEAEFQTMLPALAALGFPLPCRSANEFEMEAILNWIGEQQSLNLGLVSMVSQKLIVKH